jgi:hypothetical protein
MLDFQVTKTIESAPKGANIVLEWTRDAKTRKGSPSVKKSVRIVGRIGIDYEKLASTKEKRAEGKESKGLPSWAEWVIFPFLIRHKTKGTTYLRMYVGSSKKITANRQFSLEGKAVSFEAIEQHLLSSEKKSKHSETFTVKTEDLTRIYSDNQEFSSATA